MGYQPIAPPIRPRRRRKPKPTMQQRADFAIRSGQAKPDHEWVLSLKAPGHCGRCSKDSPFEQVGAYHPYTVKEWP